MIYLPQINGWGRISTGVLGEILVKQQVRII
jgi:hypothetical protein